MADTKISDLTVETTPPAASDYFVAAQEDTANTAVPASMLTLFHSAVSADSNQTMVAGTLYKVTMAAWASDNDFILPIAANVSTGDRVGIYIVDGDADYELDIKTGASGDLINGTAYFATSWSRLFTAGELVIFQCLDGAAADWLVEYDGRIPQIGKMYLASAITTSSASWNATNFDTSQIDRGGIVDVGGTTSYITVRRAGVYFITASATSNVTLNNGEKWAVCVTVGGDVGVGVIKAYNIISVGAAVAGFAGVSVGAELAAGDQMQHNFYAQTTVNAGLNDNDYYSLLYVQEIL